MILTPFAFDSETALIEYNKKAPPLVCVSFARPKQWTESTGYTPGEPIDLDIGLLHHSESEEHLRSWLSDPSLIISGANTAYDMGVAMQRFPALTPLIWDAYQNDRVHDVLLRQKLVDIAQGTYWKLRPKKGTYSLRGVTKTLLDLELEKGENTWRLRYMDLHDVPLSHWPEDAKMYAMTDAEATLLCFLEQEAQFGAILEDSCRQARAAWWIHLMTAWGICTDQQAVARLAYELKKDYYEVEKRLKEDGLIKTTGKKVIKTSRDTKAAKALMVEAMTDLGKEVPLTKTGGVALDKDACKESEDERLIDYADLTHLKTMLSKDIPALQKPEVHSYFEVILETGRTSSSGPNIQNPARKGGVRECYIPRPHCVFIDSDYDIIELRTFAQVCLWTVGHSKLAEALNAGYDPHLSLGSQILGISYEEALRRKKDKDVKDARQHAKPGNFGFPGGMGATRFKDFAKASYGIEMSDEQAVMLRETWFATWPEAREYFNWVTNKQENEWYFDVDSGEEVCRVLQLKANRWRGGCTYTEACNGRFQALAADIGKAAGFLIARECYDASLGSPLYGARIVNFIHDQFLVECFEEIAHEAAARVKILMEKAAEPFVPDVPATCTPALSSCWSKGTEAVYDDNKRLMVWDLTYEKLDKASREDHDEAAGAIIAETKKRHAAWYDQFSSAHMTTRPPRFADVARELRWSPPKKS